MLFLTLSVRICCTAKGSIANPTMLKSAMISVIKKPVFMVLVLLVDKYLM